MSPGKPTRRPAKNEQSRQSAPPTVSGRWILAALAITLPGALFCTWAVFCLFFWQGNWQLLYHPTSAISRTPSSVGLTYDPVSFASTETGVAQLQGWWIPAPGAHYTALYLHDERGNLSDTVEMLKVLHEAGLNVLAFDYRGYGRSHFEHPTEEKWRQDAEWTLSYLTGTRHIDPHSVVIIGSGLGANLATELAAAHSELAGVVLNQPVDHPVKAIFDDPRARLVPARLLVRDRYDLDDAAEKLRIPSLWLTDKSRAVERGFEKATGKKEHGQSGNVGDELRSWLGSLEKNDVLEPAAKSQKSQTGTAPH